ncbi:MULTISPECIES: ATP-binding protein [unclassified Lentimicrobium]|uniref:ATP-binding protein n=1 Tax=unclassified Lentimicrobium TaxID=2677434 RepID=UPI00155385D9|nr:MULTISPECIES: ATP-binding protein [unclassified Lentimicrobium]NPD47783.1 ATP-binding protein [Lentimicrobium sp. S6]
MIHKVQRYDLKRKKVLELYEKYYLGDLSLKNVMFGYKEQDIARMLENIVFIKLKRDNYQIHIGKLGDLEIDFIAEKSNEKIYIKVSYLLQSGSTIKREYRALEKIKDNYPK